MRRIIIAITAKMVSMLLYRLIFLWTGYIEAYASEIKEFCSSIIENKPVSVGGKDGLLSVAIGLAAKKSYSERRR